MSISTDTTRSSQIITNIPNLNPSLRQYHNFIHDKDDIDKFASIFTINAKHLALCMYLTMRRKYYPALSHGTTIVNRIAVSGGNDFIKRFHQSILRLETPVGTYTNGDQIIPDQAFALYVMVEPKDTVKALSRVLSRCMEAISDEEEMPNAYSLYREEIPKSDVKGQKYRQIDLDTKEIDKVQLVNELLTKLAVPIVICIETNGGFHIVCTNDGNKETGRKLHELKQGTSFQKSNVNGKMVTDHWFSITNHPTIIVPGTYQGGFSTRIISLFDWLIEKKSP
ncbi:Hypothetical protein HVR_LOCUS1261 [uncultured virus]|nr:Hypothetical protein HVR_LOCUS1261 [uncultured virus]